MPKTHFRLVLPGIAPLISQQINNSIIPPFLAKIMAKSQFTVEETSFTRGLFKFFSADELVASDLPILSLMGDKATLRIDPCYLHADRDRLLLFADDLDISDTESEILINEVQSLLNDLGGKVSQQKTDQWLLQLNNQANINLTALPEVKGKGIDQFLPNGEDKKLWLQLWNEIQMQLFNSDINQQRVEQGKLPINSVWFWGAGDYKPKSMPDLHVHGTNDLVQQFAKRSDAKFNNTQQVDILDLTGENLWVFDEKSAEDWLQELQQLDRAFNIIWQQIKMAKIHQFDLIIPDYGYYRLSPIDCWKFWK